MAKKSSAVKQKQKVVQSVRIVVNQPQPRRRRRRRRTGEENRERFRQITRRNLQEMEQRTLAGLHRKRLVAAPYTLTTSEIMRISPYIAARLGQGEFVATPTPRVNPTIGRPEDSTPIKESAAAWWKTGSGRKEVATTARRKPMRPSPSPARELRMMSVPSPGTPLSQRSAMPATPEQRADEARRILETARRGAAESMMRRAPGPPTPRAAVEPRTRLQARARTRRRGSKQVAPEPKYSDKREYRRRK